MREKISTGGRAKVLKRVSGNMKSPPHPVAADERRRNKVVKGKFVDRKRF